MFTINIYIEIYGDPYNWKDKSSILMKTEQLDFIPIKGMSLIDPYRRRLVFITHPEYLMPLRQFNVWIEPNQEIPLAIKHHRAPPVLEDIIADYNNDGWVFYTEAG